jgi:hypothetical protein
VFVLILMEGTELPERPLMLTVVTWMLALSVYAHLSCTNCTQAGTDLAESSPVRRTIRSAEGPAASMATVWYRCAADGMRVDIPLA